MPDYSAEAFSRLHDERVLEKRVMRRGSKLVTNETSTSQSRLCHCLPSNQSWKQSDEAFSSDNAGL